jgi:DNA ligase (NAD+)
VLHFANRRKIGSVFEVPLKEFRLYISRVAFFLSSASRVASTGEGTARGPDDVGVVVATSIVDFFESGEATQLIEKLRKSGVKMESDISSIEGTILADTTFVVTGTLKNYSREKIEEKIRLLGGRVSSSVSRNTDYLLLGESPGSKLEDARKLGVKIISEAEFEEMTGS